MRIESKTKKTNRVISIFFQLFRPLLLRVFKKFAFWMISEGREYSLKKEIFHEYNGIDNEQSVVSIKQYKKESKTSYDNDYQNAAMLLSVEKKPQIDWISHIKPFIDNQLSHHTRIAYQNDLRLFFSYLRRNLIDLNAGSLTTQHIVLYRRWLETSGNQGEPYSKSTVNRKLAVVKSFMNWLKANEVIKENRAEYVKGFPQSQESSLQGLSDQETSKILSLPKRHTKSGSLHTAVLYTLFYLGLRKSELLDLTLGDVQEERGVRVLRVQGKGHKVRVLPLVPAVYDRIETYLRINHRHSDDLTEPLFKPTKNPLNGNLDKRLHPRAISYIVKKYARKAGVAKTISPHSCRATCISHALDKKVSHRAVQHFAGWSTPLMIQRYDKRRTELKNSAAYDINFSEDRTKKIYYNGGRASKA